MEDISFINELINNVLAYVKSIDESVGGNGFASGAILAVLIGSLTYAARELPVRAINLLIKYTTTKLELNSTQMSYHYLAALLEREGISNKSRYLKVSDSLGGKNNVKEIGYGTHLFWFKWYRPLLIKSWKEESSVSWNLKEFISIQKLGRSHKFFDDLISNLTNKADDPNKTSFYKFNEGHKEFITKQQKRRLDTIFLPKATEKRLTTALDNFVAKEDWFLEHQIPYQFGILLYGPPGTGKTSLIRAIAAYMNLDITYVTDEHSLTQATSRVKNDIIVIEEVDTLALNSRSKDKDKSKGKDLNDQASKDDSATNIFEEIGESFNKRILSSVLTSLDGIISNHGRIIIMTTNHPDILDAALLRPGRIDIQIEVGFMTLETFNMMLKRFYPDYEERVFKLQPNITPAMVQNDIILGLKPDELIEKFSVNNAIQHSDIVNKQVNA